MSIAPRTIHKDPSMAVLIPPACPNLLWGEVRNSQFMTHMPL